MIELLPVMATVLVTFSTWVLVLFYASRRHTLSDRKFRITVLVAAAAQCVMLLIYNAVYGMELVAYNRFLVILMVFRGGMLFAVYRHQTYQNLFFFFILLQMMTLAQSNGNFIFGILADTSPLWSWTVYLLAVSITFLIILPPMLYILRRLRRYLRPEHEASLWRRLWIIPCFMNILSWITSPAAMITLPSQAQYVRMPIVFMARVVSFFILWLVVYVVADMMRSIGETEQARKNERLALQQVKSVEEDLQRHIKLVEDVPKEHLILCGLLALNTQAVQAFLGDEDLMLPPKEFGILLYLVLHENEIVARDDIYESVWKRPMTDKDQALTSRIYQLRSKIEGSGYRIDAVRGKGYRFEKA